MVIVTNLILYPFELLGSARTEGFYKISKREKAGYLCHANKAAETGQQNVILKIFFFFISYLLIYIKYGITL